MIDVSEYQGVVDWHKVYDAGVRHAYIKLLEYQTDPRAVSNIKNARAAGITVGLYQFAHPGAVSPTESAREFLRAADPHLHAGDLPPALDLERTEGCDWQRLNDWKAQWFAAVDAHVGTHCVFYSYFYFWKQMVLYPDRPVWGAGYGAKFVTPKTWWAHQYDPKGHVDGIDGYVDLSKILHDTPAVKVPKL